MSSDVVMVEPTEEEKKRLAELDSLRQYFDITYQKPLIASWIEEWCKNIYKDIPMTSASTVSKSSSFPATSLEATIKQILNLRMTNYFQLEMNLKTSFRITQEYFCSLPIEVSVSALQKLKYDVCEYIDNKIQEIENL